MTSPVSKLIHEAHEAARAAGIRFVNRNLVPSAQELVDAEVSPSQFRAWLDDRYRALGRMQFDSFPRIIKDWHDHPPTEDMTPIDLESLKNTL